MIVGNILDVVTDPVALTNTHQCCPSGNCRFPVLAILSGMNKTFALPLEDRTC